tara:strand:+ start:2874 stop:3926 length:1053 start_codon:yes stop_codon:yes gene_type:complete
MAYISFQPHDHFDCPTWTGSDSTTTITGMQFKPDSLWIKNYSGTGHPVMNNSTGGVAKNWIPSGNNAVDTTTYVASYTSDGFTLTGNIANTNDASDKYVGACWKANGGSTSSDANGSITSTVQANTTAGISIVQFTGTGANATVGHGLGVAPKYIIVKALGTADSGRVYNGGISHLADPFASLVGRFANNSTFQDEATAFNDTAATSTVFSLGSLANSNASGQECIAYCFAEIKGFSKMGFYSGSGNAKGSNVYCGFRPKWVMIKSTGTTDDWCAKVTGLTGYGVGSERTRNVRFNSNTNQTSATVTFTSWGFRTSTTSSFCNTEDADYEYLAFAEMPTVGSNGTIALAP